MTLAWMVWGVNGGRFSALQICQSSGLCYSGENFDCGFPRQLALPWEVTETQDGIKGETRLCNA
jgi:hypothetical protein